MAQQIIFRILTDVHITPAVAEQLRRQGVDAVRVVDTMPQDTPDPDILEFAFQNSFTVLTHDKKMQIHVNERVDAGLEHLGVFIAADHLQGQTGIGRIVAEVVFVHEAIQAGAATLENDVYNQVKWIV